MSVTQIDLDDEALSEVMRIAGELAARHLPDVMARRVVHTG